MEKTIETFLQTLVLNDPKTANEVLADTCDAAGMDDADYPQVQGLHTYAEAGVLTTDKGLVLILSDGSEYQITVKQSRRAR